MTNATNALWYVIQVSPSGKGVGVVGRGVRSREAARRAQAKRALPRTLVVRGVGHPMDAMGRVMRKLNP